MEPWMKVMGGIIIAVVLAIVMLVLNRPKKTAATTVTHVVTPPPPTPKVNRSYGWLWLLAAVIAAAGILTWGFLTSGVRGAAATVPLAVAAIQTAQPVEMELEWVLPNGELSRGLNSDVIDVRNFKVNDKEMSFNTTYDYDGRVQMGNYCLGKVGDKYMGSWSQYAPNDSGNMELKQVGNLPIWTGSGTYYRNGRFAAYTLRPKTRR